MKYLLTLNFRKYKKGARITKPTSVREVYSICTTRATKNKSKYDCLLECR